jgi:hypothetical protein
MLDIRIIANVAAELAKVEVVTTTLVMNQGQYSLHLTDFE